MYLPRHYKVERKKATNFKPFIFALLLFSALFFLYKKRKEIQFLFAGNIPQKYVKYEKKIMETLASGKLEKEIVSDFASISQSYLQVEPLNPSSHHAVAKSAYYELLLNGFEFTLTKLMQFILETDVAQKDFSAHYTQLNTMYRNALRANIFADEYREKHSNLLLILLYETLESRKNPTFILSALHSIEYERVNTDLRALYIWLSFISAVNSGDTEALESINEKNSNLQAGLKLELNDREILFLKGVSAFNRKEFVKALELLREAKGSLDYITIQAIKMEANIFHQQNLHEKAISILEQLYDSTGREDASIKLKISQILATKPGLRSRIQ